MIAIREAGFPDSLEFVRELFREYAASLDVDLCFQGFEQELAGLPGKYARPSGCVLLAYEGNQIAGCGALRPLENGAGEMKRLFLRPAFRGKGAGRALAQAIIAAAREIGYARLRLDTLPSMLQAIPLYRSLGFQEIAPYCPNPVPGAIFFELNLRGD